MKNAILLVSIFIFQVSSACSAFFLSGEKMIFAKNFDWRAEQGYLIKNNRGQQKFAYGFRSENVASWISKYGSITFNQIGKEFPYGGINEKGLVIEQLWLENTEYQENNNRTISELEWIQYQLDQFSSVDEVIKNINNLTIKPVARIHYFMADKNGVSAVIDFVNGKVKIDRQKTKLQVITNESSENSKKYFELNNTIDSKSRTPFDRYSILRNNLNVENVSVSTSFNTLELVKENEPNYKTYWSIVYDVNNLEFYFKSFANKNIKKVTLASYNFEKSSVLEYSLINSDWVDFQPYTKEENIKLLTEAMKMMNIEIDIEQGNQHQINPNKIRIDEVFQNNYTDLLLEFKTKEVGGNIWFTLAKGEENFKNYRGFLSGILQVTNNRTRKMLYVIPKGEIALACFYDTNLDNKMDKNFFGIPINTGFSNNKKKIFGMPPSYKTAKISLDQAKKIEIKIN